MYSLDSYKATNLGEFNRGAELIAASSDTLTAIHSHIQQVGVEPISIVDAHSRFVSEGDQPSVIIASFLGKVAKHASSIGINWFEIGGAPGVRLTSSLYMRRQEEELGRHVDFPHYPGMGLRCLAVNKDPTEVEGIPVLGAGEVVTMVHGITRHSAPEIIANRRRPRIRVALDFFLDDLNIDKTNKAVIVF